MRRSSLGAAGGVERVGERDGALVERGTDDGAFDAGGHELAQGAHVVERRDAAGGDHRTVRAGADLGQELRVRAGEHAVLRDVGDDVAGTALAVETRQRLPQVAALAGPTPRGERRTAHVETDGDAVAVFGDGGSRPLGVLEGSRAEVHAATSRGERCLERLRVADAAAHLHLDVELTDDAREEFTVRPASERSVEVDEVEPLGAGFLPGLRSGDRVAELAAGAGNALDELDGLALRDVDGGQEFEAGAGRHDEPFGRLQAAKPVGQQVSSGVAGLLGVELRGGESPVLDGGDEAFAVRGIGRLSALAALCRGGEGVNEVEALLLDAREERRRGRRLDPRPSHVRDDGSRETLDLTRPSPQAGLR